MTESPWQYFQRAELACRCCGEMRMHPDFMPKIVALRRQLGFPFVVSSAYRCPAHNQAVSSTGATGPHVTGRAIDLRVYGLRAMRLLEAALASHEFTGIGLYQRGPMESRYLHIDDLPGDQAPRPAIWTYP